MKIRNGITLITMAFVCGANAQNIQTAGTQVASTDAWRTWRITHLNTIHGITHDLNVDGSGVVATDLDLGLIHADFTGITYSVEFADTNGATASILNTGSGQLDGASIKLTFSESLDAARVLTNSYISGEGERLTGVDYYVFEDDVTPNLTFSGGSVGGDEWINNQGSTITGVSGSRAEAYGVTTLTAAHNGASLNNWSLQLRTSAVPEPSSALLGILGVGLLTGRRR